MKKMMVIIVVLVVAIQAWAEADVRTEGDWKYLMLSDENCYLLSYSGSDTNVTIPTHFEDGAVYVWDLQNRQWTLNTTNPNGIWYWATIHNNIFVTETDEKNNTVTSVTTSAKHLSYSFRNCSALSDVTLEDGVEFIAYHAFGNCVSLETLRIPNSVTTIHYTAFEGAVNLKTIIFDGTAPDIDNSDGDTAFDNMHRDFTIYYREGEDGFDVEPYINFNCVALSDDNMTLAVDGGTGSTSENAGAVIAIEADSAAAGKTFRRWVGDTEFVTDVTKSSTTVTLLENNIEISATYTADPATSNNMSAGTVVAGDGSKKLKGTYCDPIKDPSRLKPKAVAFRTLKTGEACWTKSICLYNKKALRQHYKYGLQFKNFKKQVSSLEIKVPTSNDTFVVMPPEIDSVSEVSAENTFTITGKYFGYRAPKVSLEYVNAKDQTKLVKCKVLKPYAYADANGKAGKSCMDVTTGASEITVQLPKRYPKDWVHGSNDFVINNKIGMATDEVVTE